MPNDTADLHKRYSVLLLALPLVQLSIKFSFTHTGPLYFLNTDKPITADYDIVTFYSFRGQRAVLR